MEGLWEMMVDILAFRSSFNQLNAARPAINLLHRLSQCRMRGCYERGLRGLNRLSLNTKNNSVGKDINR